MMRRLKCMLVLMGVLLLATSAFAEADLVSTVTEGCKKEIDTYCKMVTPGEGRILACLYAHSEKLSNRCEYALYDAAAQLERAVAALTYIANECDDDLEKFCYLVQPGEVRLLQCLEKNKKKVSDRCKSALKDVDLK
ncbi:MAG: cysteine rich repeat-containing protein [Syntrophobacteria bacterium]